MRRGFWLFTVLLSVFLTMSWEIEARTEGKQKTSSANLRRQKAKSKLWKRRYMPSSLRHLDLRPRWKLVARAKIRSLPSREDANDRVLSLSDVFKIARRENLDLKILKERIAQVELIKARTWAMLKPHVKLQGIYTRNQRSVKFNPAAGFAGLARALPEPFRSQIMQSVKKSPSIEITPLNQFAFSLQFSWALLNPRSIPLLKIASLTVEQMGMAARQIHRDVMFAIARAYYGVLLTDGMVDIARESLLKSHEHLRIAEARFKAGVAPSLIVTRAKLDVAKAEQTLIQVKNALKNAKLAMSLLLNKPDLHFRPKKPAAPIMPQGTLKDWLALAQRRRAEFKVSKIKVKIAQQKVVDVGMQFLPVIALSGSFRGSNASGFSDEKTAWTLSVVAQFTLYDGGTRYALLQDALSKKRQAKLEYYKTLRKVQNEIYRGLIDYNNAKAALKVAKQQFLLAKKSYRLTQERYKTGVATPIEVTDALALLNAAKIAVLREALHLEVSILSLRRAVGLFQPR